MPGTAQAVLACFQGALLLAKTRNDAEVIADVGEHMELEAELARIKQIAAAAGVYAAPSTGANPHYDVDAEARRWLAVHPKSFAQ